MTNEATSAPPPNHKGDHLLHEKFVQRVFDRAYALPPHRIGCGVPNGAMGSAMAADGNTKWAPVTYSETDMARRKSMADTLEGIINTATPNLQELWSTVSKVTNLADPPPVPKSPSLKEQFSRGWKIEYVRSLVQTVAAILRTTNEEVRLCNIPRRENQGSEGLYFVGAKTKAGNQTFFGVVTLSDLPADAQGTFDPYPTGEDTN
jgi:hypothetical protein